MEPLTAATLQQCAGSAPTPAPDPAACGAPPPPAPSPGAAGCDGSVRVAMQFINAAGKLHDYR